MEHIIESLKDCPIIKRVQFYTVCGLEETNISRHLRDFASDDKLFPLEVLKKLKHGIEVYHDMIIEVLEDSESALKLKKYLNYKQLFRLIKEDKINLELQKLSELDDYITKIIEEYGNGFKKVSHANGRLEIEELNPNLLEAQYIKPLETVYINPLVLETLNALPSENPLAFPPQREKLEIKNRNLIFEVNEISFNMNQKIINFLGKNRN